MSIDQLAPQEPPPDLVSRMREWQDAYPWLQRAFQEIGPGARAASDGWRARIEDELKTTLDFKVRPDGTAAIWCGLSGYDFHHDPTPNELFKGLAEAYRCELKRRTSTSKVSASSPLASQDCPKPQTHARASPPPAEDSLTHKLGAILLPRVEHLMLIFLTVTALTLVLSSVAIVVR